MAVESHPLYPAWNKALEQLVDAERRFYTAIMEDRPPDEIQQAALDLDEARAVYRKAADAIG